MKRLMLAFSSFALSSVAWAGAGCGTAAPGACPMPIGGGAMGLKAPLLLAILALGYWVLRVAEKEASNLLKITGRVVAAVLALGALGGLLCGLCGSCRRGPGHGMTAEKKAGAACPYSGGSAADAAVEAPAPK